MLNNSKLTREQFLSAKFLKITLIQLEKSLIHHNRFIFQIVSDRKTQQSKKKYSQIKKFCEELQAKLGMKELTLESHLRSAQQYKSIENLFNKLNNGGYIMVKQISSESQLKIISNVRNYLYNLLLSSIQMNFSSQQETQISKYTKKTQTTMIEINNKGKSMEESFQGIQKSEKKLPQIQGKQKQKQKQRQKSGGFKNVIKNIYKSKKQTEQQKKLEMLKSIKTIWISQKQEWLQKQFIIMEGYLIYYEKQDHLKKIILLKNFDIILEEKQYFYIKISHLLLKQAIKIRIDNKFNLEGDQQSHNQYLTLLFLLKETQGKVDNRIYNFVWVRITNKKNKFIINQVQKRPTKELNIKLGYQIEPQLFNFHVLVDSSVEILLPIYNNYGKYHVQVTQQKQGGLLANFRQNSIQFDLPVQNIYDQIYNDKAKMKFPDIKSQILPSKQCNYILKLQYMEMANRISYISSNEKDRFQGLQIPQEFSRDQFRIQKNRMKRILFSAQKLAQQIKSLQNFEYPIRSIVFYVFLFFVVMLFDANNIVHYSLIVLLSLITYFHPTTSSYIREIIIITNLGQWVQRVQEKMMQKKHDIRYRVSFNNDLQKKTFLQKFNIRTKIKRNIIEKYHRLHEILLKGQLQMTEFVTLSQKIKNIVMWYHHKKTKELFIVLLAILIIIMYIPLRFFFLVGLYTMYSKGMRHENKVRQLNKIILLEIIRVTIQEKQCYEMRAYFQDINKQFQKRLIDTPFYKLLKENLTNFIEIDFDPQIFMQARSFKQLLHWLSDCKKRFSIKQQVCQKYRFNSQWSAQNSTLRKLLLCVYAFIINVPSDRHILIMKSSEMQNERNESDSQDDQFN